MEGNLDDNWFAGLIFWDKLSSHQGNLFHVSDFLKEPVYTWGDNCSTSVIFPAKLPQYEEKNGFFNWFLVLISCQFDWWKKWLTAPLKVFPYMVRGNNQFLLQFNHHCFSCIVRIKLAKALLFQTILLSKNC